MGHTVEIPDGYELVDYDFEERNAQGGGLVNIPSSIGVMVKVDPQSLIMLVLGFALALTIGVGVGVYISKKL